MTKNAKVKQYRKKNITFTNKAKDRKNNKIKPFVDLAEMQGRDMQCDRGGNRLDKAGAIIPYPVTRLPHCTHVRGNGYQGRIRGGLRRCHSSKESLD